MAHAHVYPGEVRVRTLDTMGDGAGEDPAAV